jgi:hypothetical protein
LVLAEFHPVATALETAGDGEQNVAHLRPAFGYFPAAEPDQEATQGSYAAPGAVLEHPIHNWWNHTLADTVNAVLGAGLRLEFLQELPRAPYQVFSFTEPDGEGQWRLRGGIDSVPLLLVLRAQRPMD